MRRAFQSPYGGGGRLDDRCNEHVLSILDMFQSPYGGRGRLDFSEGTQRRYPSDSCCFNHLTVAGVG